MERTEHYLPSEQRDRTLEFLRRDTILPKELTHHLAERFPAVREAYEGIGAAGLRVGVHTERVLGQYEWYLRDGPISQKYGKDFLRAFLALHDLGKPRSLAEQLPEKEHEYTWEMLKPILAEIQINERMKRIVEGLLHDDPIGLLLQGKMENEDAYRVIVDMASIAEIPPDDMYQLALAYFLADAGSYTMDAGGERRLDFLFTFDRERHRVEFSETAHQKIDALQQSIMTYGKS